MRGGRSTAAIVLGLAAVVAAPAPSHAATLVRTTVDPRERSHPIAAHFLGISAEVPDMAYIAGNAVGGDDGPLEGLLRGLGQAAGSAPLVRFGGGTAATPTLDGSLVRRERIEHVARSPGAYRVWMPAASAAPVTIRRGGR